MAAWQNTIIEWKRPTSWVPVLSRWIRPYLNERGIRYLSAMGAQDICWDDSDWREKTESVLRLEFASVVERLADALASTIARTFHGCRTTDAGLHNRAGILRNDPRALADEVRRLVAEEGELAYLRPTIEQRLETYGAKDRDTGKLYVVIDDRALMEMGGGHYLLYGSEWILGMLCGDGHSVLRRRGIPTILAIDLPLRLTAEHERIDLARTMLREWTRVKVNGMDFLPRLDFTFCVEQDIPGNWIVSHMHPAALRDPLYQFIERRSPRQTCPSCADGRADDTTDAAAAHELGL